MKSDDEIKHDVEEELQWDPSLKQADIAIAVKDGVVVLGGFVRRFRQKKAAEAAAKRVAGVLGIANDIAVRLPVINRRPDPDIARDVVEAIRSDLPDIADSIKISVEDGWVTLKGEVDWHYLVDRAEDAVKGIRGIRAIRNFIKIKPVTAEVVKSQIETAFRRNAALDARRITVEIRGSTVNLKGTVRSWVEREEAERVAWSAPGVAAVDNQLQVDPSLAEAA